MIDGNQRAFLLCFSEQRVPIRHFSAALTRKSTGSRRLNALAWPWKVVILACRDQERLVEVRLQRTGSSLMCRVGVVVSEGDEVEASGRRPRPCVRNKTGRCTRCLCHSCSRSCRHCVRCACAGRRDTSRLRTLAARRFGQAGRSCRHAGEINSGGEVGGLAAADVRHAEQQPPFDRRLTGPDR